MASCGREGPDCGQHFGPLHEHKLRPRLRGGAHSVYTLPSFATGAECEALIAEAAKLMESYKRSDTEPPTRCRLALASAIETTMLHRILHYMEEHMPSLAASLWGTSCAADLVDMSANFSPGEPAVNVYTAGGRFAPHTDKEDLTLLVPLSPPGAFEGGGTAFWSDDHLSPTMAEDGDANDELNWVPHEHAVAPVAGTAIIFGGDVTHAGLPVTSGTRSLFVMSFNLRARHRCKSPTAEERAAQLLQEEVEGNELAEQMDMNALADFGDDFASENDY